MELAHEHGFLTEPAYRRLLQKIGEKENRAQQSQIPEWDREKLRLYFQGTEIRTIRSLNVARNIVAILDAFEIDRWDVRIDTPGQLSGQPLHDAVHTLNKGLKKIKFHVSGDGEKIQWRQNE